MIEMILTLCPHENIMLNEMDILQNFGMLHIFFSPYRDAQLKCFVVNCTFNREMSPGYDFVSIWNM